MPGHNAAQVCGQSGARSLCLSVEERIVMFTFYMRYVARVWARGKTLGRVT